MKKLLFLLTVLLFSSCDNNEIDNSSSIHDFRVQDVSYEKGSKLKLISNSYGGEIWYAQSEYEYDNLERISKVSHPMYDNGSIIGVFGYEAYVYNTKNQLVEIEFYNNNINWGFVNLRSEKYSYDNDGNIIKKTSREDSNIYYYDKNRLTREDIYNYGVFIKYTEYEYDKQGNLVKESTYSTQDDTPLNFSIHTYRDGLNVETEVFVFYNVIGKTNLRKIRRFYDINDNLIYLESQELSVLSSMMSYTLKYEYY